MARLAKSGFVWAVKDRKTGEVYRIFSEEMTDDAVGGFCMGYRFATGISLYGFEMSKSDPVYISAKLNQIKTEKRS